MKMCLECKTEFKSKTDRRKFCSDKCKVKWHRKHPKKDSVSKFDFQALYNEFKAAIQDLGKIQHVMPISQKDTLAIYNTTHTDQFTSIETIKQKTFQEHMNEIAELDTPYEYEIKTKEIQASNLSEKQKNLLYLNMKSAKF